MIEGAALAAVNGRKKHESSIGKTAERIRNVRNIGGIDKSIFENEFGKLQTDEVILTNERDIHIRERHGQDYPFFETYVDEVVNNPDIILIDEKHEATALLIKKLPEINLNIVLRLATESDNKGLKNSIMTFHRVRDSNLKKMLERNKALYKRE